MPEAFKLARDLPVRSFVLKAARQLFESTDYYDEYAESEAIEEVIAAFRRNPEGKQYWKTVPLANVKRIWSAYVDTGYVRDEDGMEKIAKQVIDNIWKLNANTIIMGHTSLDINRDVLGNGDYSDTEPMSEEELDQFADYCTDPKTGQWIITDTIDKFVGDAYDLYKAKTAEQKLQIVDRVFNRAHMRGDIASLFIDGGRASLNQLSEI